MKSIPKIQNELMKTLHNYIKNDVKREITVFKRSIK